MALLLAGCANRGMQAEQGPDGSSGTGGVPAAGGRGGSGGTPATGGTTGSGGTPIGTGGRGGSGGTPTGTGGVVGTGGMVGTGGTPATGGTTGAGGTTGTGGTATGGTIGTGGMAGAGGKPGTGGMVTTGGTTGTGGVAGSGGAAGGRGGTAGSMAGTGGAAGGAGGKGGAGANICSGGGVLDCSSAGALTLPSGAVTSFSTAEWNATTGQFCDADGLRGRLFSYEGPATGSTATAVVDTTAQNLKLSVTAKDWAGGGVIFESCTDVSAYKSVSFTASLATGTSLSGCTWQVQLQTQDQRSTTDTDPTGGTCASNCYRYPAAALTTTPSTTGTPYTVAFTSFSNPASSAIATPTQVVGIQWQVTSSSSNGCTAELHIDNIKFQ